MTVGVVVTTLELCSCCSLCMKTSMCSRPRKPALKPGPKASLFYFLTVTLASFSVSLSTALHSSSKSSPSTGYRPAKTMALEGRKPGSASTGGLLSR